MIDDVIKRLYENEYDNLVRYFRHKSKLLEHSPEDLAQETFVLAWEKRHQLHTNPVSWLFTIGRNVFLGEIRKEAKLPEMFQLQTEEYLDLFTEETLSEQTKISEIISYVDAQHPEHLELFILNISGLTIQECADITGQSYVSTKRILYRIRKDLREHYDWSS